MFDNLPHSQAINFPDVRKTLSRLPHAGYRRAVTACRSLPLSRSPVAARRR